MEATGNPQSIRRHDDRPEHGQTRSPATEKSTTAPVQYIRPSNWEGSDLGAILPPRFLACFPLWHLLGMSSWLCVPRGDEGAGSDQMPPLQH